MNETALQILDKVNSFYSQSFSQLITVTLGLVAFIGVFVPVLTTYYQNRNIKIEKKILEDFLDNKINEIKEEVLSELREELISNLKEYEEKQGAEIQRSLAGVFHLQANHQLGKSQFRHATDSILMAIESCIAANDELNLQRGFNILIYKCLPKIKVSEEPDLDKIEEKIDKIRSEIKPLNVNGRYKDTLSRLDKEYRALVKKLNGADVEAI